MRVPCILPDCRVLHETRFEGKLCTTVTEGLGDEIEKNSHRAHLIHWDPFDSFRYFEIDFLEMVV